MTQGRLWSERSAAGRGRSYLDAGPERRVDRVVRQLQRLIVCGALLAVAACGAPDGSNDDLLALVGGTIYPSPHDEPIADGLVIVRAGTIESVGLRSEIEVPVGALEVDLHGLHLFSGFQNSHVHFTEPIWRAAPSRVAALLSARLRDMLLRYGFTTVVDTSSSPVTTLALRDRIESGEVSGPRILTAGTALYPENGVPFYLKETMAPEDLAALHTPSTESEAASVVAAQIDSGADIVKLFIASWVEPGKVLPMGLEIARAAVREAHGRGALVFAHALNVAGLELALDAGVDVLAHALDDDRGWNETHVERMKAGDMTMIPTLKLFGGQPYTKFIQLEVRDWAEAGGRVVFGTDVGYLTDYDPTEEYTLMAGAGLDWRGILDSLTTAPAALFGEADLRGRVEPGMRADLVALASAPTVDVAAFSDVAFTVLGGRLVYRRDGG